MYKDSIITFLNKNIKNINYKLKNLDIEQYSNSIINNIDYDIIHKELEIEARLYDFNTKQATITKELFNSIKNSLNLRSKCNVSNIIDHIYLIENVNNIKKITLSISDNKEYYKLKHTVLRTDNKLYNFKFDCNIEYHIKSIDLSDKVKLLENNNNLFYDLTRNKTRYIYKINQLEIHLSHILLSNNTNEKIDEKYEVEIEFSSLLNIDKQFKIINFNNNKITNLNNQFNTLINFILCIKSNFDFIYSGNLSRKLGLLPFKQKLFNASAGLSKNDLSKISVRYSITDKADGVRRLLFINNNGDIFFISNKYELECLFSKYEPFSNKLLRNNLNMNMTIIDGELINNKHYYAFDCILYKGKNVYTSNLIFRLIELNKIYEKLKLHTILKNKIIIYIKKHYIDYNFLTPEEKQVLSLETNNIHSNTSKYGKSKYNKTKKHIDKISSNKAKFDNIHISNNFIEDCKNIWYNRHKLFSYELDGLIFTPQDGSYIDYNKNKLPFKMIYKWKPDNTVDVIIKYNKYSKVWEFYTGNLFNSKLIEKYKTFYYNPRKDTRQYIPNIYDNQIWEMLWDDKVKQFQPYRLRDDKPNSNAPNTINNTIDIVMNPVYFKQLVTYLSNPENRKFGNIYYQEKGEDHKTRMDALDINMRSFHNYVKQQLILDSTESIIKHNGKTFLLDLSCGRGGDINKYINANIDVVLAIDISNTAIIEARNRWNTLHNSIKHNKDYYFLTGNITKPLNECFSTTDDYNLFKQFKNKYGNGNSKSINNIFNIIVSNFAIHYYFNSEEAINGFLQNINNMIAIDGVFIGTILNGHYLNNVLNNRNKITKYYIINDNILSALKDNKIFYKIEKNDTNNITVSRIGWDYPIPEPLINTTKLIETMKKINMFPKTITSFNNYYNKQQIINKITYKAKYYNDKLYNKSNIKTIKKNNIKSTINNINNKHKKIINLSDGEKLISFLHETFIFTHFNLSNNELSRNTK